MNHKTKGLVAALLLVTLFSQTSCSYTVPEPSEAVLLNNSNEQYAHWNGIGQIMIGSRRYCTAFLLDTRDPSNKSDRPAYIVTSGHCASLGTGTAADTPYQGQVQFNFFEGNIAQGKRYDIRRVNWASLANTDVAVMELDTPLKALLDDGITPLKPASSAPDKPVGVKVIGAPSVAPGLRLSECTLEPSNTTLIKNLTVHTHYQKHDCKGIAGGSSGSPVLDAGTGEVLGVLAGTTYGVSKDDLCFWHGLCGNEEKKSILPDQASHSFPVDYLAACFIDGRFDIDASTCTLKPHFNFRSRTNADVALHKKPISVHETTPTWGVDFSMSTNYYRFKTVRDAHACHRAHGYSDVISTVITKIDEPIGREAGLYYLCLVGVNSPEQPFTTGLFRNTQILTARLVTPVQTLLPEPSPSITVEDEFLYIKYGEKEDRNIWTQVYTGPAQGTDCAAIEPRDYENIGSGFFAPVEALPLTLCSYMQDRNLSTSKVRTDLLQRPDAGR